MIHTVGKKLIIGNWKMNLTIHEASLFIHKLDKLIVKHSGVEVVVAPSFLSLPAVSLQIDHAKLKLAAQDFYWRDEGAYTGEVSARQLHGLVKYALVGHSERRHVFGEKGREIRNKVQAAFRNGIVPVLCVGESASERAAGETLDILNDQIIEGVMNITSLEAAAMVIAYEPTWAIGAGRTPTPSEVERAVKGIRAQIKHLFGEQAAHDIRVLYGASVTKDNAMGFLQVAGVDGLLVGGESLDAQAFSGIVNKAQGL